VDKILAVFSTLFDQSARGLAQTMSEETYFVMLSFGKAGALAAMLHRQVN
jgi:hypothetical protein